MPNLDQLFVLVSFANKTTCHDATCTVLKPMLKPKLRNKCNNVFNHGTSRWLVSLYTSCKLTIALALINHHEVPGIILEEKAPIRTTERHRKSEGYPKTIYTKYDDINISAILIKRR